MQLAVSSIYTQLIFVTTAKTGGGVLFSSRRTFFLRERENTENMLPLKQNI